jgi:hypothetical protein
MSLSIVLDAAQVGGICNFGLQPAGRTAGAAAERQKTPSATDDGRGQVVIRGTTTILSDLE